MAEEDPSSALDDPAKQPVITGVGVVTPWGMGAGAHVPCAEPEAPPLPTDDGRWLVADEVLAPGARRVAQHGGDRAALLAIPALRFAAEEAGIDLAQLDPARVGLVLGSAFAALTDMLQFAGEVRKQTPRFVSPLHFPHTVGNYAAGAVARALKINGPNLTFGHGPQAGLHAVVEAAALLRAGWADVMFAGGVDTIDAELLTGLVDSGRVKCAGPFANQPAEGACLLCLETASHARARQAAPLASLRASSAAVGPVALSASLCGRRDSDEEEVETLRQQVGSSEEFRVMLSSRHLQGNAFAASCAGQVALGLHALQHTDCPAWDADHTAAAVRQVRPAGSAESVGDVLAAAPVEANTERVALLLRRP
jgi:3-oxoacyl-(acyl-carrier-protein) synthase